MVIEPEFFDQVYENMPKVATTSGLVAPPTSTPPPLVKHILEEGGAAGNRTLWVVFVIMMFSSLAFYAMAFRVPVQKRFFHIITAMITTFAAISYFAMASGDGISLHDHVLETSKTVLVDTVVSREVYWARYVDWSVTTPLLLIDLGFLAGVNGATMFVAIVADLIMVLTGLFAAFGKDEGSVWGYYAMACIAYLVIVYQLATSGYESVKKQDKTTQTLYTSLAGFTLLLWTAYPIVWGVADGSRIAGVDAEIISYAILDVLAKPVFGFWLLLSHDSASSSTSLGGFWSEGLAPEGAIRVGDDDDGA